MSYAIAWLLDASPDLLAVLLVVDLVGMVVTSFVLGSLLWGDRGVARPGRLRDVPGLLVAAACWEILVIKILLVDVGGVDP